MTAILKRELKSLFHTMTAQIFSAVLIAIFGIYFIAYNINMGYPYFSYSLYVITFILIVIVPILTMRSFSEERKQKTDQILLTSPVSLGDIVLGKYFAMCLVLLMSMLVACLCPLIIDSVGTAYYLSDYSMIFAFFIVGCFFISIGMFVSSLTESQVIAAVCTMGILFVIFMWDGILTLLPTSAGSTALMLLLVLSILAFVLYSVTKNWIIAAAIWAIGAIALLVAYLIDSSLFASLLTKVLSGLSVTAVLDNFANTRVFDAAGIINLIIATAVMLFLTAQTIQKRRWN